MLTYQFAKRHQVVFGERQGEPTLFYVGQLRPLILQAVQQQVDTVFSLSQVDEVRFTRLLEQHYQGQDGNSEAAVIALSEEIDLSDFRDGFSQAIDLLEANDEAPVIKLINAVLTAAIKRQASDIHIESFEHRIAIRIRVDGILRQLMQPPVELAPFLIARVKIMAGLDIAEKRLPQDGRISTQIAGRAIDVRVSTIPVANAERVVLRILDKAASSFILADLSMPITLRQSVSALIHRPHGIFLVVGPTGSGKTTTLYAALSELDIEHNNVMTVEDPIEYFLDGISQTQVNSKSGMTFAVGLRAILRQDPDVVMVGEIRDLETAEMAVQASLTGHTVFSTLHTNTAVGAIMRLKDMGIEPFLIGSSLSGVLSQRLVRKLCESCKVPMASTAMENIPGTEVPCFRTVGCEKCDALGYRGRIGIYELMTVDDTLREMIVTGAEEHELTAYTQAKSMSLYDYGLSLVATGLTSLAEVKRVAVE